MAYFKTDLRVASPMFSSRVLCTVFALALAACAAPADQAHAGGTPPALKGKPLPTYPAKRTDCYLLLKDQSPYITSSAAPVCVAVLANFNKFCDEPPQYNRRKIHFSSKDLTEPKWEEMDASKNLELVKQTYMASHLPQYRETHWGGERERLLGLASSGKLRLSRAEISADPRGGMQTVYRLENVYPPEPPGFDQPFLMFSDLGAESPAPLFRLNIYSVADLWAFRGRWHLIRYWPAEDDPQERRFIVYEILSSLASKDAPVVATERCTIQHKNDQKGVNAR